MCNHISQMTIKGSTKQGFQSRTSLGSFDMSDSIIILLTYMMKMQHRALCIVGHRPLFWLTEESKYKYPIEEFRGTIVI